MKITKRNGNTSLYDDQKIVKSILRANAEVPQEQLSESAASLIADEVFARLTADNEIITTEEIRGCIFRLLSEKGYSQTARRYMDYRK